MRKLALLLLLIAPAAFGQVRYGDTAPIQSAQISGGAIYTVPNAVIAWCASPANGAPCTNRATTYTDITLGTPCPTATQVVLADTNACVGTTDGFGNWGVWVAAGTYDYTVTIPGGATLGPYTVTLAAGTGTGCQPPGAANAILYDLGSTPAGCGDSGYLYTVVGGVPVLTGLSTNNDTISVGNVLGALTGFGAVNSGTGGIAIMGYRTGQAFLDLAQGPGFNLLSYDSSGAGLVLGIDGGNAYFEWDTTGTTWLGNSHGSAGQVYTSQGAGLPSIWSTPSSGITLQHDGTNNGSQSLLNLAAGSNVTVTDNGTGTLTIAATSSGGSTTPGGSSGQVQYNAAGAFGGMADLTYSSHTVTLGSSGILALTSGANVTGITAAMIPTLNQNTTGTASNLSGTPALPNGTTATTQTTGDNSTKLATDAFVLANATGTVTHSTGALTLGATGVGNGSGDLAANANLMDLAPLTSHNAQFASGASVSSAGSTVTCANCSFALGDVGKSITLGINGVGPASGGSIMVTTVTGYTSVHVVTVAATAGTTDLTGNNVVWGTPDATAINGVISALNSAGGGKLQIPCGYFYIDATVQSYPNITIEALGPAGEGSAAQDCVTFFPAGNVTTVVQIGVGSSQQFQAPRIVNLSVNDLFSQATNGFLVDGASNGIFDATMARGFNAAGAAGYKYTFGGGSTQASTWAMNNVRAYDCTTCVDASLSAVDGPLISGGEFLVKNTNTNFTGVPRGIVGSALGISTRTHIIVGENAGATQDAIGVQVVNPGSAANVQAKFEAQTTGHGIGIDFAASGTRGAGFFTCQALATCVKFESGSANNLVFVSDAGNNNTQLVDELNASPQNYVITQSFIVGPHHTVAGLPSSSATPKYATALVTDGNSGTDCTTGSGSTLVLCENGGSSWSAISGGGGGGGANQALSNLSAVAINTSLLPGAVNSVDAGSSALPFRNAYIGTAANHAVELDGSLLSGNVDQKFPNENGTFQMNTDVIGCGQMPANSTGDVTNTGGSCVKTVAALQGTTLTLTTPAAYQFLQMNSAGSAFINTPGQACTNPQTGASYTVLATDRGCIILGANSGAMAYTLPQAGTTGFASNFYTTISNSPSAAITSTGPITVTTTTSKFENLLGQPSVFVLNTNQRAYIFSPDNANYYVFMVTVPPQYGQQAIADYAGQTAAIGSSGSPITLLTTPSSPASAAYTIRGPLSCDTSVSAATVTFHLEYTDPSSTAQTLAGSAATCTTLGASSVSPFVATINVAGGTAISFYTTIVGSPNYDAHVMVEGAW